VKIDEFYQILNLTLEVKNQTYSSFALKVKAKFLQFFNDQAFYIASV